jgi:hypothetical protein
MCCTLHEDALLLPAILNRHTSALFEYSSVRLLGLPRGYKYCTNVMQYYGMCIKHVLFTPCPTNRLFICNKTFNISFKNFKINASELLYIFEDDLCITSFCAVISQYVFGRDSY